MKRKIVEVRICKLVTTDMEAEIMKFLADFQAQHPNLEWDFNIFGIQFVWYAAFRGYIYE